MNNPEYEINFVIPAGPTGPANGLNAYGGKYNNTTQTINLTANTFSQIPLLVQMPQLNMAYTQQNSITILEAGNYELNYYIDISTSLALTLTFAVRLNGTNIPSTIISKTLNAGIDTIYNGSVILELPENAVIDMAISSTLATLVTLNNSVNASLSLKKLN